MVYMSQCSFPGGPVPAQGPPSGSCLTISHWEPLSPGSAALTPNVSRLPHFLLLCIQAVLQGTVQERSDGGDRGDRAATEQAQAWFTMPWDLAHMFYLHERCP